MMRQLAAASAALALVLLAPAPASAHGERTQEAFLRSSTVLLHDVSFSATTVKVGEPITVSGYVRIMNSWPDRVIAAPSVGFLSLAMPGPVLTITDRRLGDEFTPQSVRIHKGATYRFSVTAVGRVPGRWHVHPSFAVHGTGTLVGAGEWVTVTEGTADNSGELATGGTIDLAAYGLDRVVGWHLVSALVGLAWLLYWFRKPTLARIPEVAAGRGRALLTRGNTIAAVGFLAVVVLLLIGGYAVTRATVPEPTIPLQVSRTEPRPVSAGWATGSATATSTVTRAEWQAGADRLELHLRVTNTGPAPVRLARVQIAELTLATDLPAAGEVTVRVPGAILREYNLLPLKEPQVRITALLFFADSAGVRQVNEVDELTSPVLPK